MTIGNFVDLFYIKEYLHNKDLAFMELIKNSVQNLNLLIYTKDTYRGIIYGNNIHEFAKSVMSAGLSTERISQHIKTLYSKRHNGTKKNKEKYQNKTYQGALFDQVKDKFEGIMLENMSDILANALFTIIQDAAKDIEPETASKPRDASRIVLSYTIPDDEKKAILNLCGLICGSLQCIKQKIETIDRKQHELRGPSEDKNTERWKAYLELELNTIKNDLEKQYSELKEYCFDASKLLENRQHLHKSFKAIYDIATQIYKDEYKEICSVASHYSTLSALVSSYQKNYENLTAHIQSL